MAQASKTFRIFVSSTFTDLKEERNALQERVFPELRKLCEQYGCRFQAIDLRWGVSEEASLDQRTMKICLDEIARCQKITPRPNFIVLLGDRYGWHPLPYEIKADEFEEILKNIQNTGDKELLGRWYWRDNNALPPVYCLQSRTGEFTNSDNWGLVERRLRSILLETIARVPIGPADKLKYTTSATEQEIIQGVLHIPDADKHVFCFSREFEVAQKDGTRLPTKEMPPNGSFHDFISPTPGDNLDFEARTKLDNLKKRLSDLLGKNMYHYKAEWDGGAVSEEYLKELCGDTLKSLSQIIIMEASTLRELDPLEREIGEHELFGKERVRFFTGRMSILKSVDNYLKGNDTHPLGIFGEPGSGKTALMAHAIEKARENCPEAEIIFRFIGATPSSADGRSLVESLFRQLSRSYGENKSTIPTDYRELVNEFPKWLSLASKERPLILFLDALDQLSDINNTRDLSWLPSNLPEHTHVIVSVMQESECFAVLKRRLPEQNLVKLKTMSTEEGKELLDLWLKDAHRTLQDCQRDEVLSKFEQCRLPLYLKLVFEEARRWKSYSGRKKLSQDISGVIKEFLERLSSSSNHGDMIVSRTLGYLAAAKNGLTEDELLDVLSRDTDLYAWFISSQYQIPPDLERCALEYLKATSIHDKFTLSEPQNAQHWLRELFENDSKHEERQQFLDTVLCKSNGPRLPVAIWSRLLLDLEPYLTKYAADGTSLMTFYHPTTFGQEVRTRYLYGDIKKARHRGLARYFASQNIYIDVEYVKPNMRKASELVFQLLGSEDWLELGKILTDFDFLEAKVRAGMALELIAELKSTSQILPESSGDPLKSQFQKYAERLNAARSCLPETFHLWRDEPGQIFPQNYPYLCGFGQPAVIEWAAETAQLWRQRGKQWFQILNKYHITSVLTMAEHTEQVLSVYGLPDGRIVSGCADGKVYIWDPGSEKIRSMNRQTGMITGICFLRDGRIVLADWNGKIYLWDIVTDQVQIIDSKTKGVSCMCLLADERLAFGSYDNKLCRIDLNTDKIDEISLENPEGIVSKGVISICVSPDGRIAGGGYDRIVFLWDPDKGKIKSMRKHSGNIRCLACTRVGQIISGSSDHTVRLWDPETDENQIITQHMNKVNCLCVTPDNRVVSADSDGMICSWDPATGQVCVIGKHSQSVICLCSLPGRLIASGSSDHTVRLWKYGSDEVKIMDEHSGSVTSLCFLPEGRIASGSSDHTVRVWNPIVSIQRTVSHEAPVTAICRVPDGNFASGDLHGSIIFWSPRTGETQSIKQNTLRITSLCCLADGQIASGCEDGIVRLWNPETNSVTKIAQHTDEVTCLCALPDGQIVSGGLDNTVRIWDPRNGNTKIAFNTIDGINDLVYFPDNSYHNRPVFPEDDIPYYLAAAGRDQMVWLYSLSLKKLRVMSGHNASVHCVHALPNGLILSAGEDRRVLCWNPENDKVDILFEYNHTLTSLCILPDGNIASACDNDTAIIFHPLTKKEYILGESSYILTTCSICTLSGKCFVSGGRQGILYFWESHSGQILTFNMNSPITQLSSNDGILAVGLANGEMVFLTF